MKKIYTLAAALLMTAGLSAQTADTVSVSAAYVNDVYYSFQNGIVNTLPKDNWDIAFEINGGQNASILANTQGTGRVYQSPFTVDEWDFVDTTGLTASWQRLDNAPDSWSLGAYNSNPDGNFDLGWGQYDMDGNFGPAHAVNGDSVFVVKTVSGSWKKLRIDRLYSSKYSFTYANLDGSNEVKDTIVKADYSNKNFAYYSLGNAAELDREPNTTDWDVLFTKYVVFFDYPDPQFQYQSVTGLLQNKEVEAVKAYPVNDLSTEDYSSWTFGSATNTIGYDWKSYDYDNDLYNIADSTVYFVKTANLDVWKIVFTGFGGSANGNYIFTKKKLDEPSSGISELANNFTTLEVYPNPAKNFVNIIYNYTDSKTFNTTVNVMDLAGRLVLQKEISVQSGLNKETLNIASLERGVYVVTFPELGKTQKLIIE